MGLVKLSRCALVACFFSAVAVAQPISQCKVADPELQATYSGGCKDGLADGYGEAQGSAVYRGEFKAGRKHGKGVKTWRNGDRYEGDFIEDRREGTGMYQWGRRSAWARQRYTGGYLNDLRHGYGVYEWPNGERYAGRWEDDRIVGTLTKGMIARARGEVELAAVMGRVGARVCRELEIGVGTRDIVRGTVTAVTGANISVLIDDPGRHDHEIDGRRVTRGAIVSGPLKFWLPCI